MYVKNDLRGRKKIYSQEVIDFLKANSGAMTDNELSEAINRRFNLDTSRQSVGLLRRYYGIIKGHEICPVLMERIYNGYIKIKTAAGKWVNKHTFLYEQANGKVPKGHNVIFLDGNHNNFSLDNLALVNKEEQIRLSQLKLRFNDPALTQIGIAIIKHQNKIRARKGER